jgi:phospholipid/cholesterol/gamma-HCH transport system substrate-binding protein
VNFALVGVFVLVLGASLLAGLLWLASGGAWQKNYDIYQAVENESVAGLNLSAPVKYNGVDVGKVQSIRIARDNPDQVVLLLAIERGTPVKTDSSAMLKTQGLTGIAYVEISGGSRAAALLKATGTQRYPQIETKPSLSARLENVLTSVLGKLDSTSSRIDALLSDANRAAISTTLTNLATITATVAAGRADLTAGMHDAAQTFAHSARVGARVGPMVEKIARSADSISIMSTAVADTSARASRVITSTGTDMQHLANDIVPQLQELLTEMSSLTASLHRLSEQSAHDPRGLLFGRDPSAPGPGESSIQR